MSALALLNGIQKFIPKAKVGYHTPLRFLANPSQSTSPGPMTSASLSLAISYTLPVVVALNESTIGCEWSNSLAKPSGMSNFDDRYAKPQLVLGISCKLTPTGGNLTTGLHASLSLCVAKICDCFQAQVMVSNEPLEKKKKFLRSRSIFPPIVSDHLSSLAAHSPQFVHSVACHRPTKTEFASPSARKASPGRFAAPLCSCYLQLLFPPLLRRPNRVESTDSMLSVGHESRRFPEAPPPRRSRGRHMTTCRLRESDAVGAAILLGCQPGQGGACRRLAALSGIGILNNLLEGFIEVAGTAVKALVCLTCRNSSW